MNKNKKDILPPVQAAETSTGNPDLEEFFRNLKAGKERPLGSEAVEAALEAAQRFAAEQDAEDSARDLAQQFTGDSGTVPCKACGYRNREGNKFCGKCGGAVATPDRMALSSPEPGDFRTGSALVPQSTPYADPAMRSPSMQPTGNETHHYHHHYHHHYFPGAQDGTYPRMAEPARDSAREEKLRSSTMALRGDLSRAEASVRAITQEWVLACNTKHLDDLLELYVSDALVMRSNYPPIRGAAAIREFFFGALDAGLGEVEVEPLRVDVVGDLAYEAGRCKALIPSSSGKRREERGKYLWVVQRQTAGEWKLVADCWSSDLTLATLESDIPSNAVIKTNPPKK